MGLLVQAAGFLLGGGGFGAVTSIFGFASGTVGFAALKLGGSLLLSTAANALLAPKQPDLRQSLSLSDETPPYRFVYGIDRAAGTPAPIRIRRGVLYGCWILNSRPSDLGDLTLYFDKRAVTLTGDPFDFAGPGATATNQPFLDHVRVWFGRGDQVSPPDDVLAEAPWAAGADEELFLPTDAWQGRTVMWAILKRGKAKYVRDRWPNQPPQVEVEAKFSKVWDMRDVAQDPDDPDTWEWSANSALCTLDALRTNPMAQYEVDDLLLEQFEADADISDETVALDSGGSEPRYPCGGTLQFGDGELEDQLRPLLDAGARRFIRVGGRLGVAPGAYVGSSYTLNDLIEGSMRYSDMKPRADLPTEMRTSYTSAARGYEDAELAPWPIPGASGLPQPREQRLAFVQSATQAMRLRKIAGLRAVQQRKLSGVAPPSAADCIAGSVITAALPDPYSAWDATFEVQSTDAAIDPLGENAVAMRCPLELLSTGPEIFAWTPATDEEVVVDPPYIEADRGTPMPGTISATTGPGVDLDTGGTVIPRIRFAFDPADIEADGYAWEYRVDNGDWTPGGTIEADILDGSGKVFGFLVASVGPSYSIRVYTIDGQDRSDPREISGIVIALAIAGGAAVAEPGRARFTGTGSANVNFGGVRIYRTTVATYTSPVAVSSVLPLDPGEAFNVIAGDAAAVNLFANPDFASGTDWTLGTGWSIGSGVATHAAGTNSSVSQTLSLTAAEDYRWSVTITAFTAGTVRARIFGTTDASGALLSTLGLHQGTLTAPAAPVSAGFNCGTSGDLSIDGASLVLDTADCLPLGQGYYWIVPVTLTGTEGTPDGPHNLIIT